MKPLILFSILLFFCILANASFLSHRVLDACSGPTFWNSSSNNCDACPSNCQVCALDSSGNLLCSSCYDGYDVSTDNLSCVLSQNNGAQQGGQNQQCWDGTYWSVADNQCDNCPDPNCQSCEQNALNAEIFCSACYESWVVSADGMSCVSNITGDQQSTTCWNGTYWSADQNMCADCPANCETCEQNDLNANVYCSACYEDWVVSDDQLSCVNAPPTTCWDGTYLSAAQNMCADCPANCKTCEQNALNGNVYCVECYLDWAVSADQLSCVDASPTGQPSTTCWDGTYWSAQDNMCDNCVDGCMTCGQNTDGNVTCSACYQGYNLSADGLACNDASATIRGNENCWEGSYLNVSTNNCDNCPANCQTCNVDPVSNNLVCSLCYGGYNLSADSTSCN